MIRIANVYINRNSGVKVSEILIKSRFPWGQIEINKRRTGKIVEIWVFFLNFIMVIRLSSMLKNVRKWVKQGYMPSYQDWVASNKIVWPKPLKVRK